MFWCLVPKPKPGPKPASFVMDGWMLPFFSVLKPPKIFWVGGSSRIPLANSNGSGWAQRRAGERIDRDRSEPPRRRERNETTATERRAGSMVRIRWAPGDRGEAPASSRFRRETERERERERDGEGAKRPCGDAVRASRPGRDERKTSITSFLADASLASRRALRRSRTTKIQTTRPI